MVTEIYIISGFLGSGKTTFIQKLLRESFAGDNVVLIENDFGEVSVDAALLKQGGITVKELSAGCICCSLSGDFVQAVEEIITRFHPDKIVIEPSGVGKLSDILCACRDRRVSESAKVTAKITVADAGRCRMYLENFGEFFEDQIRHADLVLLSRAQASAKTEDSVELIKELNPEAVIVSAPWETLSSRELLALIQRGEEESHCHCHHHHSHSAEQAFDTVTIRTDRAYQEEQLKAYMDRAVHELPGRVIRAKGILGGTEGYLALQYVPDELQITPSSAAGNMLCLIGEDLDQRQLTALFEGM